MYTEDEARCKFCSSPVGSRSQVYCVTKNCMAWRWCQDFDELIDSTLPVEYSYKKSTTHGYCGLAGKP